ncbi:Glu/Leu/Phe/Val dehydrogenase dimerization domain-containing protein [Chondrinema litorale]|uniref:Glu/Leu/Phe/Val dehydrogenase dimerization domain-containing protein n=1 Tax=Chondrinema litorale TaxID=2994555 RepID=UPI002543BFC3|nr:Glu/Leu/Phe/Val dehydrogenase dimerization domain-containing protein [Chondrinema litorale]UZR95594.1 amino acid dehydrogenase [Chondrinema litorale]
MKELLEKFEHTPPEIVFEWHDRLTEAKGWVVINSLRGGAAGGGTRMRKGLDKREVESLAKTMEVKFTVSGPAIGGAKSGIDFDPADPRKKGVLERWYKAVIPLLKNYYGTGGDMNVDEIEDVIPITEDYGLWHPQEGIVHGHFNATLPKQIHMIGRLRQGVSKILEDQEYIPDTGKKYTVADMITGFGVAESVRHYYQLWNGETKGKRAIIQGWGNVGAAAALYLAKHGVKIVGIIDKDGGLIDEEGMGLHSIKKLFHDRKGNTLVADNKLSFEELNNKIWNVPAEIFIPAAASRLVSKEQVSKLIANKLEVVACGANVPFKDQEIFHGPIATLVDNNISLIPDFIANCGMARVFAYLMEVDDEINLTDDAIFHDVSTTILNALEKTYKLGKEKNGIYKNSLTVALESLT